MTNIYVLAVSDLPAPWTRIETYDGKYLRTTTTTASHGSTGGASQHRHNIPAGTSGNGTYLNTASASKLAWMPIHSHSTSQTYSSYSNNDPLYRTYSLWRMDLTTWETSYGTFPVGCILLATATVSCTGMSRYSDGDGKLIKLGTPGSTGGRSTHTDHTATITLNTYSGSGSTAYGFSQGAVAESHGHTATLSSTSSSTVMPARVQTRMYQVTGSTPYTPPNVVCFFDDTPSANWTSCGWSGRFIEGADSAPTNTGSDSHDHTSGALTSSPYVAAATGEVYGSNPRQTTVSHTHPFTPTIDSESHVPEYVYLCTYYLNTTIYPPKKKAPMFWW